MTRLSTTALLFATLQITAQALPNLAQDFEPPTPAATASPTVVGLPVIATATNANCAVEGSLSSLDGITHDEFNFVDPLECMYTCMQITFCQAYSWNTSVVSSNDTNCVAYSSASVPGLPIVAGDTNVFFSAKSAGCYSVVVPEKITSEPFVGEDGVYVNTAVSDCGIEGTYTTSQGVLMPSQYRRESILECQSLCDSEDGCISYGFDYNTNDTNCGYTYSWLVGALTPGKTGVFWSEGAKKTGYPCFSNTSSFSS